MNETAKAFEDSAKQFQSMSELGIGQADKQARDGLESLKKGNLAEAVDLFQLAIQSIGHARDFGARAQTYEAVAKYLDGKEQ